MSEPPLPRPPPPLLPLPDPSEECGDALDEEEEEEDDDEEEGAQWRQATSAPDPSNAAKAAASG